MGQLVQKNQSMNAGVQDARENQTGLNVIILAENI